MKLSRLQFLLNSHYSLQKDKNEMIKVIQNTQKHESEQKTFQLE